MKTSSLNRREFLKQLLLGLGALSAPQILSACRAQNVSPTPPQSISTRVLPSAVPTAAAFNPTAPMQQPSSPAPATPAPPGSPDIAVAHGSDPEAMLRQAINALGGMQRFVKSGARVVIKPNICVAYHTYEYAATTNPWVIGAIVKLAREAGAQSVSVMDFPFGGTSQQAYSISGIADQVTAAGGEMVTMTDFKFIATQIPTALDMKQADIYDDILKADVLIDVPIAKHHSLAGLTLGMKNLMGTVRNRPSMHRNLGQRIADLTSHLLPALTIVDAMNILTANGPTGGNLNDVKPTNTLIASADIVAADSYATTLFNLKPDDIDYIRAAAAMGLGISDLSRLKVEEINV